MQLDFDPANSLMLVNWPNFEPYTLADTQVALSRLVNTIKNYDVKKLLVDATTAKLGVGIETYEDIVRDFTKALLETKIEKIARVTTMDLERENTAKKLSKELPSSIQNQHFSTIAEAKAWLLNT